MVNTQDEPEIIINGVKVSDAMAMTIRVAINDFIFQLTSGGVNLENEKLKKAYLKQLADIQTLIYS